MYSKLQLEVVLHSECDITGLWLFMSYFSQKKRNQYTICKTEIYLKLWAMTCNCWYHYLHYHITVVTIVKDYYNEKKMVMVLMKIVMIMIMKLARIMKMRS